VTGDHDVQPIHREDARRGDRRFDTTHLRGDKTGKLVHRDYGAHFFKWGFAHRLIDVTDRVLEVGCGVERPLANVLAGVRRCVPAEYLGVDINKIKIPNSSTFATFIGEFNFVDRWRELPQGHFTKAVSIEVIEHMNKVDGLEMLRGIHECLAVGGTLLISTPVFNGKAAVNHIHEYEEDELRETLEGAGFKIVKQYGTFASYPVLKKVLPVAELALFDRLREYYSDEVMACFIAPLYPEYSRNIMWVCEKEEAGRC
jgi:SAM-dependent methyltransferase